MKTKSLHSLFTKNDLPNQTDRAFKHAYLFISCVNVCYKHSSSRVENKRAVEGAYIYDSACSSVNTCDRGHVRRYDFVCLELIKRYVIGHAHQQPATAALPIRKWFERRYVYLQNVYVTTLTIFLIFSHTQIREHWWTSTTTLIFFTDMWKR